MKANGMCRGLIALMMVLSTAAVNGGERGHNDGSAIVVQKERGAHGGEMRKVVPAQKMAPQNNGSANPTFDRRRFEREVQTLKKVAHEWTTKERMQPPLTARQQEHASRRRASAVHLEKAKIFGQTTRFFQGPHVPALQLPRRTSQALVSNVSINGKARDTIGVGEPFSLTFSFAPNHISALINIYFDADSDGAVSAGDILLEGDILLLDDDDNDADLAAGAYKIEFTKSDIFTALASTLLFEVNDFQSASSAMLTVHEKPLPSKVFATVSPSMPYLACFIPAGPRAYYVFTDSAGRFSFNVDRKQTSQVELKPFDFTGVSNGYIPSASKTLSIASDTTNVAFTFTPATTFVEGTIKDQKGNAAQKVMIEVDGLDFFVRTTTDTSGHYKAGVVAGLWRYYFSFPPGEVFMRNSSSGLEVNVQGGTTVQKNIVVTRANNAVSGKVAFNAGGLGGVPIFLDADSLSNVSLSSGNGAYAVPVYKPSTGAVSYSAIAYLPSGGYFIDSSYRTGIQPGAANIDFTVKKIAGGLQGKITDVNTGMPIAGATISASGPNYHSTASNDSGFYRMSLSDGTYSLFVYASNYYPKTDLSVIIAGSVVTKNITMHRSGSFSGIVKDEEGAVLSDVRIEAIDSSGYWIGSSYTDEEGKYTMSGLQTSTYRAYANAYGYISEWYDNAEVLDSAKSFQVVDGFDTQNINFALSRGGSISGHIMDKSGKPVAGVEVGVFDTLLSMRSYTVTNDSGFYNAAGLATGSYIVETHSQFYVDQWYKGVQTPNAATRVKVVINQETPGIDFALSTGGSISGMVKNRMSAGVPNAFVVAMDTSFYSISYTLSNDSGYYVVRLLAPGRKYFLEASASGYSYRWYDNVSTPDSATAIVLQEDEKRENINFVLSKAGSISGRVFSGTGQAIPYANIEVQDTTGIFSGYTSTDAQGKYLIAGLPAGLYFARAYTYPDDYLQQWFDHKATKKEANKITVVDEHTTANVNFDLMPAPTDSIVIRLSVVNIPDTLVFSKVGLPDYYVDYWWGVRMDVDNDPSTGADGNDGCEIELVAFHYKVPGEPEHSSNIIDGTNHVLIEWVGNNGYLRHTDMAITLDPVDKKTLIMRAPKRWAELNSITSSTKYYVSTFSQVGDKNGGDRTVLSSGFVQLTDPVGDVGRDYFDYIDIVKATPKITTSVAEQHSGEIPTTFSLEQNYPNPFNPSTVISYQLPVSSRVTLKVYDIVGREVAMLVDEVRAAGSYHERWKADNVSSGVYFYTIRAGSFTQTRKMMLLK